MEIVFSLVCSTLVFAIFIFIFKARLLDKLLIVFPIYMFLQYFGWLYDDYAIITDVSIMNKTIRNMIPPLTSCIGVAARHVLFAKYLFVKDNNKFRYLDVFIDSCYASIPILLFAMGIPVFALIANDNHSFYLVSRLISCLFLVACFHFIVSIVWVLYKSNTTVER